MFAIICIYFILLSKVDSLFVEMGEYPDHLQYGINLPDCGLREKPEVFEIFYPKQCFGKSYANKTYEIFRENDKQFIIEKRDQVLSRIFGGRDAKIGEAPWTVRLDIFRTNRHNPSRCTGELVTFQWVMTAAHCLNEWDMYPIERIRLTAGWSHLEIPVNLSMLFRHPEYNINGKINETSDIALIKLTDKHVITIHENRTISLNFICLPKVGPLNENEENVSFSGWGMIYANGTLPNILQIADIVIKPANECPIKPTICAEHQVLDPRPCRGDSGGPMVQNFDGYKALLIGVTQSIGGFDETCAANRAYGQWVSVMHHIPWILKTIKDN